MPPGTEQTTETLGREYADALQEYVGGAGEAALMRAYELGRRAAAAGVGVLELALMHHDALVRLDMAGTLRANQAVSPAAMATQFLAESLSPFEMRLRSFQANMRTLGLGEARQQDADIERAREQLRTILDATTALIYLKDAEGRYLFVNRRFQEVFGIDREHAVGKRDEELLPGEIAAMLRDDDRVALEAGAPRELEETLPAADGPHTYIALKFPLIDARGVPYGISCVATDITERKRTEEALRRAEETAERERQLKHAVEVRDRFLDITSHELKTPLTSLELQVQSLTRLAQSQPGATVADPRVRSKCDTIVRQVERINALIDELLAVGKIASGRMGLTPQRVELGDLVGRVLLAREDAIRRSGSDVSLRTTRPIVGDWDPKRIEAVVAGLLSNALKFGERKPIEIAVDGTATRAVLSVQDHGMGISLDAQERIFERFERDVSVQHFGGFGLGLWVAREVVTAHGGSISVESRPGEGAKFTIELPLATSGERQRPAAGPAER